MALARRHGQGQEPVLRQVVAAKPSLCEVRKERDKERSKQAPWVGLAKTDSRAVNLIPKP